MVFYELVFLTSYIIDLEFVVFAYMNNGKPTLRWLSDFAFISCEIFVCIHLTKCTYYFVCLFCRSEKKLTLATSIFRPSACNAVVYSGLTYNIDNMSGNQFLNFFLFGICELPANFLGLWLVDFIGRRWTGVFAFLASIGCALGTVPLLGERSDLHFRCFLTST